VERRCAYRKRETAEPEVAALVEEFYATREPWRWMHLVCGAHASAISFGKARRQNRKATMEMTVDRIAIMPATIRQWRQNL
jgi:hypothetical protein